MLEFNMEILIPGKDSVYIETGLRLHGILQSFHEYHWRSAWTTYSTE